MKEGYTIVWSFRNRIDVFKKSIETADKTTPKDVDFCLIDAASNDETIKELRMFCNNIENRVIRICESAYRSNLSEAWNLGMMLTDNRYVIYSSSDVEFTSSNWFSELSNRHKNTGAEYILIDNHAVFLIDKKIISKMGWFDEEFVHGPHFDVDFMIRASEHGIKFSSIPNNGHYRHGDSASETIERGTLDMGDRLPMNHTKNEEYFKIKWQCGWPGWKNHLDKVDRPHPPTNISQVARTKPEIDPHPLYTRKYK